ncbi:MAG TPA: aldose 1-epimerase family protein [Nocardioidaceae bacterium]|nr:aldose 1-epimerase family protein [Nocardioidaceae bacterium]
MSLGGREHSLADGPYQAVVTEVGAGLRVLRHEGRDLVRSYDPDQVRPRYSGAVLAPWPNRVADGCYVFDGETHQLPLSEPERSNALHGLAAWDRFELQERTTSSVTLLDRLVPRSGYPFLVEVTVVYALDAEGLRTTVTAHNAGSRPAPWGTAAHPYLRAGTQHVDDVVLTVPADRVLDATPDRLLPLGAVPVESLGLDFRQPRRIGDTFVDHAYTGLRADEDGLARVLLSAPSGAGVECVWDPGVLPWVQVHTADTPEAATHRTGLAVEPMTCAPDAFNSGDGLVVLPPGGGHSAAWTIRAVGG